jgi:hypothetical protein
MLQHYIGMEYLVGENVRIIDIHGDVYEGEVDDYIPAEGNIPEPLESIVVEDNSRGRLVEFRQKDIKRLTVLA